MLIFVLSEWWGYECYAILLYSSIFLLFVKIYLFIGKAEAQKGGEKEGSTR